VCKLLQHSLSELLSNLKKQARGLIGHSNAGSCRMNSSGSLGALEQVWLNEGRVAMVIPLKQLEKLCPVVYNSTRNRGTFICCTKDGDVVLKNNTSGSSRPKQFYPLRLKRRCPLCRWCKGTWNNSSSVMLKKRERLVRHN